MKTNRSFLPVIAATALTVVLAAPSPGYAADKKAAAKETTVETTSAKAATPAKTATAKEVPAKAAEAKEAPAKAAVVAEKPAEAAAPEAVPAPTPVPEKKSFFKKLFGGGDKKEEAPKPASAEGVAPVPPPAAASRGAPSMPPPPQIRPAGSMPSIDDELSAMQKEVDSKAYDAAKDVAKVLDVKEDLKAQLRMPALMIAPMVDVANPGQGDKVRQSAEAVVEKYADKYESAAMKSKAIALAKVFTADELEQLEKFYGSSAGKKALKMWGRVMQAGADVGRQIEARESSNIREAVIKEMKRNDLKIPKGLE